MVCYSGNRISYEIAKRIVKLKYISLVNLILDKEVVTELIQNDLTKENLKQELDRILDIEHREKLAQDYQSLEDILGGSGASERIAKIMVEKLKS